MTNRRKGDDVKSSWPLYLGLHTCYNGRYRESLTCEGMQISKSRSQFGLESATRLHEVGIASNRGSERHGEYVPGPCTHRPSHHLSGEHPKWSLVTVRSQTTKVKLVKGVKS